MWDRSGEIQTEMEVKVIWPPVSQGLLPTGSLSSHLQGKPERHWWLQLPRGYEWIDEKTKEGKINFKKLNSRWTGQIPFHSPRYMRDSWRATGEKFYLGHIADKVRGKQCWCGAALCRIFFFFLIYFAWQRSSKMQRDASVTGWSHWTEKET